MPRACAPQAKLKWTHPPCSKASASCSEQKQSANSRALAALFLLLPHCHLKARPHHLFQTRTSLFPMPGGGYLNDTEFTTDTGGRSMSFHWESIGRSFETARAKTAGPDHSYSRERWRAFEAWQERARRSAATVRRSLCVHPDRDLRRPLVPG
jgi:hypothetical protein